MNSVSWQHLLLGGTPGAWAMGANLEEVKTQHTLTGILCNMVVMGEGHRQGQSQEHHMVRRRFRCRCRCRGAPTCQQNAGACRPGAAGGGAGRPGAAGGGQRQKKVGSVVALLPGKFLRVLKVFTH